jgi:signal transduction histidine kinase
VYRIVQEGLTNVLRHAPGSPRIAVGVHRHAGEVVVTVDNDAGARGGAPGGGRGIIGMRERAAVYGGQVTAGPVDGGWRLRAVLHLEEDR